MKLLIVTQVIDKNHPILGFFHRWVEFFAKECESIEVICLQAGTFDLPDNVTVHSLGKENGDGNKIKYLWRFCRLLFKLRHRYDNVFVHMNQIYVVLAGWYWRLSGKSIGLWYTYGHTLWLLRLATRFTRHIFSASRDSFPLTNRLVQKKLIVTGHGIDTDRFSPGEADAKDIDLLTVGRLSPIKNLTPLLPLLKKLQTDLPVRLTIIGVATSASDQAYVNKLKDQADSLGLTNLIDWVGAVPNEKLPLYLRRAKVFVQSSQTGSLDKALLEPLAVGVPVVTGALGAKSIPLRNWQVSGTDEMAAVIMDLLKTTTPEKIKQLQNFVIENHSLQKLIPWICTVYNEPKK